MIHIHFFAHLREKIGQDQVTLELREISVRELLEELKKTYSLERDAFMVAINEEYANPNDMVREGDMVALIPPVSGG